MLMPGDLPLVIENRLRRYLSRDRTGIRHEMLRLFTRIRSLTIHDIFDILRVQFPISYHSVAAMVGIIAARIGILHVIRDREGSNSVYQLKAQYFDLVQRVLS